MDEQSKRIYDAVKQASQCWLNAFNNGDARGCAAQYEKTAIMHARPFGTYKGNFAIQAFWQKLIDDGFSDVQYIDPSIQVLDEHRAELTSDWKMNKAQGVIHKELWVMQEDSSVKLREDVFEVT
jgi:hypothetical protein